jgi:hypothetical protein
MAIKVANNQSMTGITALPSAISGGAWTLISTTTASSSATLSITSGLDDTYDVYCFRYINIHPATDAAEFQFNGSTDTGSNYNVTKTTSSSFAFHYEDDSSTSLGYSTANDLAQSTSFQNVADDVGNDNDQSASGYLYLYNPASTTFVKHFINTGVHSMNDDRVNNRFQAGYFNTTSAIDAMQFKFSSGNTDAGVVKLYGIS